LFAKPGVHCESVRKSAAARTHRPEFHIVAIENLLKKPPEIVARHPLGRVPYIEHDGMTIYDSTVIDEYLEERVRMAAAAAGRRGRARAVRRIEQYADESMLVGSLPPIWIPYWSEPAKRDLERMEKGREAQRSRDLSYFEKLLGEAPPGGYICGDFTIADVPMMMLAMVLEVDQPDLRRWPKVKAYLDFLRERPDL
jgi:glutathione S-transferase